MLFLLRFLDLEARIAEKPKIAKMTAGPMLE